MGAAIAFTAADFHPFTGTSHHSLAGPASRHGDHTLETTERRPEAFRRDL